MEDYLYDKKCYTQQVDYMMYSEGWNSQFSLFSW